MQSALATLRETESPMMVGAISRWDLGAHHNVTSQAGHLWLTVAESAHTSVAEEKQPNRLPLSAIFALVRRLWFRGGLSPFDGGWQSERSAATIFIFIPIFSTSSATRSKISHLQFFKLQLTLAGLRLEW